MDAGCGYGMRDARCAMRDAGRGIRDTGYGMRDAGFPDRMRDAESGDLAVGGLGSSCTPPGCFFSVGLSGGLWSFASASFGE